MINTISREEWTLRWESAGDIVYSFILKHQDCLYGSSYSPGVEVPPECINCRIRPSQKIWDYLRKTHMLMVVK